MYYIYVHGIYAAFSGALTAYAFASYARKLTCIPVARSYDAYAYTHKRVHVRYISEPHTLRRKREREYVCVCRHARRTTHEEKIENGAARVSMKDDSDVIYIHESGIMNRDDSLNALSMVCVMIDRFYFSA